MKMRENNDYDYFRLVWRLSVLYLVNMRVVIVRGIGGVEGVRERCPILFPARYLHIDHTV